MKNKTETKLNLIYMAAGNSRRFGSNKLLRPLGKQPMYRHTLDMLIALSGARADWSLTVVSQYEEILTYAREAGVRAVYSPKSRDGLSFTIRAGIEAASEGALGENSGCAQPGGFVFFTADQPYLRRRTVERFLETVGREGVELGSLSFAGKPGSPTFFSFAYVPELLELTGDMGGRIILRRHEQRVLYVEAECEKELFDVDYTCNFPQTQLE